MGDNIRVAEELFSSLFITFFALFVDLFSMWFLYLRLSKLKFKKSMILYTLVPLALNFLVNIGTIHLFGDVYFPVYIYFVFFYWYSRKQGFTKWVSFFYSVYPIMVLLIFTSLSTYLFTSNLPGFVEANPMILFVTSYGLSIAVNLLAFRFFKIDLELFRKDTLQVKKKIVLPVCSLMSIILLLYALIYVGSIVLPLGTEVSIFYYTYQGYLLWANAILNIALLIVWNNQTIKYFKDLLQREKEQQYEELSRYTREIEALYAEVRGFRHDFGNVLISLNESIQGENIEEIKQTYEEVLQRAQVKLNQQNFEIEELTKVKHDAVKSILSAKLFQAQEAKIEFMIEVETEVDDLPIESIQFIRILSILLDNALEAAKESIGKKCTLAFFRERNQLVLLVKNSRKPGALSLSKVFEAGYSTKGENRGTGLATVRSIVDEAPTVHLDTQLTETTFTQVLKMELTENETIYSRGRLASPTAAGTSH